MYPNVPKHKDTVNKAAFTRGANGCKGGHTGYKGGHTGYKGGHTGYKRGQAMSGAMSGAM